MLKKSKIMSLVLALLILTSAILPLSASAAISFSDVPSEHIYFDAITNLAAEGIINGFEDGTYKPEDAVTRAQFTKVICYATYVGEVTHGEGARATFSDVAPNHWAINNIITAKNAKIINGFDDGTFKPEQTVLYEQAVKMAACAIGYPEARASREGGYPQAYLKFALKQGLLENVDGKEGEALTRAKVAQLIDNMRDAQRIDIETGEVTGSLRDEVISNHSSAEGRIVAINKIALDYTEVDTTLCKKNQIELELTDGTTEFFWIDNLNVEDPYDYLGRVVTVYYDKESGGDSQVTEIVPKNNRNKEYDVELDDVDLTLSDSSKFVYYDEDGNKKTVNVDPTIFVVHNGQAVNKSFSQVLTDIAGKSGKIKLVCTQNADVADLIFVSTYEIYYVTSVNKSQYTFSDSRRSVTNYNLDEAVGDKKVTYIKDGAKSSFSAINQYTVLSVAVSDNSKIYEVLISNKVVTGIVEEKKDGNKVKLSSSSEFYEFAVTSYGQETAVAGSNATFRLDAFGKVVMCTATSATKLEYGYLADVESDDGITEAWIYKMSTSAGRQTGKAYTFADTIKIDNTNYKPEKDATLIESELRDAADDSGINETIDGTAPTNTEFAQPIRFGVNSEGKINTIITKKKTGDVSTSMNVTACSALTCTTDGAVLGGYSLSGSIPVLYVPSNRATGTYETKSKSYFRKGNSYYVQIVNKSSMNVPAAIYVYGVSGSGGTGTGIFTENDMPMIVKSANPATHPVNKETTTKLELITVDGTETLVAYKGNYTTTDDPESVAVGDIVRVAVDSEDYISEMVSVVTYAYMKETNTSNGFSKNEDGDNTTDQNEKYRVIAGKIHDRSGGTLRLAPSFNPSYSQLENISVSNAKIYAVNISSNTDKVRLIEVGEISVASTVFVYTANGTAKLVVIYE